MCPGGAEQFCAEYQAVYDAMTNPPDADIAVQQDLMVRALIAGGVWTLMDVFYLFAQQSNTAGEALINWINPGTYDATGVNLVAGDFVSLEGFTGNGISKYINLNYNPHDDGINLTLDSACIFAYQRTDSSSNKYLIGCDDLTNALKICPTSGISGYYRGNDAAAYEFVMGLVNKGFYFGNRTANNAREIFFNNISKGSDTQATNAIPDLDMYILAQNRGGPSNNSDAQVSCAGAGASMDAIKRTVIYDALQAYMTYNGKQV